MIINIPDDISPKDRKERLKVLPVVYALKKYDNNIAKAAKFLGVSLRGFRDTIRRYQVLDCFRKPDLWKERHEEREKDPIKRIYDAHLLRVKESNLYKEMNYKDQLAFEERIRKLYY